MGDTADPNNRILSRPVECAVCPVRARKETGETREPIRHPGARGRSSAGSTHPRPTRTGCASSTGGAAGPVPPVPRRRGGYSGARRGDRGGRGTGLRRDGGTSSYGARVTRHLASLGMPVRRRSPRRGCRRRAGAEKRARTRRGRPRACRLRSSGPQEPGRWVDRVRCMLAARAGEARTSAINTREVAAHHRAGGAQVEVPRHGRAGLMEAPLSVRAEGALGAALGAGGPVGRRATRRSTWKRAIGRPGELCPALLAMYGCGA